MNFTTSWICHIGLGHGHTLKHWSCTLLVLDYMSDLLSLKYINGFLFWHVSWDAYLNYEWRAWHILYTKYVKINIYFFYFSLRPWTIYSVFKFCHVHIYDIYIYYLYCNILYYLIIYNILNIRPYKLFEPYSLFYIRLI